MFFFTKNRSYHGFNVPKRWTVNSQLLGKLFPAKHILYLTLSQKHPYHLITRSPWPFMLSLFLGIIVLGVVGVIQGIKMASIYFHIGFYGVILILGRWFLDIWIESLLGHHTRKVARGLRLGFFLMILSEVMFFWAFFWTLFHYTLCLDIWTGNKWPYLHEQPHWCGPSLIGTAFLIWSCIWLSEAAIWWKWLSYNVFMYYIFCTIWCGIMFLYIQIEEFLFVELTFNCGSHGSIFFMLTGFHFFHVLLGLVFITTMYCRLLYNWYIPVQEKFILLNITSWYWQFVDYVWIFVYFFLYIVFG